MSSHGAAGASTRPAVLRDSPTRISYVQLALYGFFLYAFGPSLSLLRDEQGTSRTVASLHGTALSIGAVTAAFACPWLVRKVGRGNVLRLGSAVLVVGTLLYVATRALPLTLAGVLVAGAGSTFALVGINAFISDHQGPAAPRSMSEGNGVAALAGLLAPLAVGLGVAVGWGWRPALVAVAVGFVVLEVARGRRLDVYDGTHGDPASTPAPAPPGSMPRRYWVAWSVIFAVVGTEFCMTLWGSELLRDQAGLGDAAAAASLVTIVGGMAIGRLGGSPVVSRVDPERLLIGAFTLTVVGFFVAWTSSVAAVMLVGFLVAGIGIGLHWPLAISRALRASGGRSDRGAALASVAAGIAAGLAPFVLGALADSFGVHTAFLLVPAMLAAGIAIVALVPVPFTLHG